MKFRSSIRKIFGVRPQLDKKNIETARHYVELFNKWYPNNKIKSVYYYTSFFGWQQNIYFIFDEEIKEEDYELIKSELTIEIVACFPSSIQPNNWSEYYLYTSDGGNDSSGYLKLASYVCGRKVSATEKLKLYKKI